MKNRKLFPALLVALSALALMQISFTASAAHTARKAKATKFTVRVENISQPNGFTASNGVKWSFALSPGAFLLNDGKAPLFREGKKASKGLEMQAEDGDPSGLINQLEMAHHSSALHGVYNMPVGATSPGPIRPGNAYEFSIEAQPGTRLFMTMMNGQSNDWFYAPDENGIELFPNGKAVSGDVTNRFILFDAGTEVDEELGIGPNQGPRQPAPNTGTDENGVVMRVKSDFAKKTAQLFRVTITPEANSGM